MEGVMTVPARPIRSALVLLVAALAAARTAYRSQVQGEPQAVYHAGETFYEAPNSVHLVSANASRTEQVRFLAYFTCDRDTPLSVAAPTNR
jgi:hypothetical protein